MRTETLEIDGERIVFAKLTLDQIEEWEKSLRAPAEQMQSATDVYAVNRRACRAAIERAKESDPALVGRLDIDGLSALTKAVMRFSHLVSRTGEEESP